MGTLYENIKSLCDEKEIKPGKMCTDIGISKSTMTDLKNGRRTGVSLETAQKIADYFGVSVDRVLGSEQKEKPTTENGSGLSPVKKQAWELIKNMDDETLRKFIAAAKVWVG